MKHSGRAVASVGVGIAAIFIARFTNSGCVPATMFLVGLFFIWADAE